MESLDLEISHSEINSKNLSWFTTKIFIQNQNLYRTIKKGSIFFLKKHTPLEGDKNSLLFKLWIYLKMEILEGKEKKSFVSLVSGVYLFDYKKKENSMAISSSIAYNGIATNRFRQYFFLLVCPHLFSNQKRSFFFEPVSWVPYPRSRA